MRNLFSILAAFFVGILLCISVIACANDPVEIGNNSNDDLRAQITALTTRINELETRLAAAEGKVDNIEDEIDYEIVFQKFNQYFDGCDCNYDEQIAGLKKLIDEIQETSNAPFLKLLSTRFSWGDDGSSNFIYDGYGRLIKLIGQNDTIVNISYNDNVCTITFDEEKWIFTFDRAIPNSPLVNYVLYTFFTEWVY